MQPNHIVAEISTNWIDGRNANPLDPRLISQKFEEIIAVNAGRGYRLHSFQLHRLIMEDGSMNETIVAVFERSPA